MAGHVPGFVRRYRLGIIGEATVVLAGCASLAECGAADSTAIVAGPVRSVSAHD